MPLSETLAAYDDCFDYFARAQRSEKGIRIPCPNISFAARLRFRLYQARSLERRESKRLYEITDHRWGKSADDKFQITMKPAAEDDGTYWVYIEPISALAIAESEIEDL